MVGEGSKVSMQDSTTRVRGFDPLLAAVPGALLLAVVLLYALSALAAIYESGWRYPAFDQFRLYIEYLGRPFPDNILQVENGHRPILPALLRVAEIACCGAAQTLQLAVSAGLALLAWGGFALSALRERAWSWPRRLCALALMTLALFWLGNARMLLHGNESVHAYLVVAALIGGAWAVTRAEGARAWSWTTLATLCAAAATFSFGPGIVVFVALLGLGWLRGLNARALLPLAAGLALFLVLYLFALPGDAGVRGSLQLAPLASLETASVWLAAPWVQGWLGLGAQAPLQSWLHDTVQATPTGRILSAGATVLVPDGVLTSSLPLLIGALGYALLVLALYAAWRRRATLARTGWLALTLALFAAGAGVLIAMTRLDYFAQHPDQLFAERYLIWSCLFWAGLGVLALALIDVQAWRRWRYVAVFGVLMLAEALWPTQLAWQGWGAAVHRLVERSAIAARLGIWDPQVFPDNADASRAQVETTLRLMRERNLGPFRAAPVTEPETGSALADETGNAWELRRGETFDAGRHRVLRVEGILRPAQPRGARLRIIDQSGRRVGEAVPSFHQEGRLRRRGLSTRMDGYDGYVLDPAPGAHYRVVAATAR